MCAKSREKITRENLREEIEISRALLKPLLPLRSRSAVILRRVIVYSEIDVFVLEVSLK